MTRARKDIEVRVERLQGRVRETTRGLERAHRDGDWVMTRLYTKDLAELTVQIDVLWHEHLDLWERQTLRLRRDAGIGYMVMVVLAVVYIELLHRLLPAAMLSAAAAVMVALRFQTSRDLRRIQRTRASGLPRQ